MRVRNVYPFTAEDRRMLAAVSDRIELIHEGDDSQEWVDSLGDDDVAVLSASHLPGDRSRLPGLRWLSLAGVGIDHLPAGASDVVVTNGTGVNAVPMAEYVLACALAWAERLGARLANQAERAWTIDDRYALGGMRLRGRVAVVVGYGGVGREVARLLDAFGVRIIAVKARPERRSDDGWREPGTGDPAGTIPARFAGTHELPSVMADADLLVVSLPLTDATRGLIDGTVLAAARRPLCVINVGRGAVVDEEALLRCLDDGTVDAAYLDVTELEPLPVEHPFWAHERVLITPHVSGIGDPDAMWHNAALLLAENLRRHLDGRPLVNLTDPGRGY